MYSYEYNCTVKLYNKVNGDFAIHKLIHSISILYISNFFLQSRAGLIPSVNTNLRGF